MQEKENTNSNLENLQKDLNNLKDNYEKLQETGKAYELELESLKTELASSRLQNASQSEENENKSVDLQNLRATLEELQATGIAYQQEIQLMKSELEESKSSGALHVDEYEQQINILNEALKLHQEGEVSKTSDLQSIVQVAVDKLQHLEAELSSSQIVKDEQNQGMVNYQQALDEASQTNAEKEALISYKEEEIEKLQEHIQKLEADIAEKENSLVETKSMLEEQVSTLESEQQLTIQELETLKEASANLSIELQNTKDEHRAQEIARFAKLEETEQESQERINGYARLLKPKRSPICTDSHAAVMSCYKEHPGKTLYCSKLVQAYMSCVQDRRMELLSGKGKEDS
jgi:DNA repair exonuclease SbcCD ATPase subunit